MEQILANPLGALAQADSLMRGKRQSRLADLQLQAAEKRQQLGTLLPQAMAGDKQATAQVADIDPELFLKLDETKRETLKQQISENAGMLAGIIAAPAPLRPAMYRQVREIALRERGATEESMPESYDEARVMAQVARARKIEDILKVQPGAGPEGKGAESWAIRTLLSGDPSSPEYAAAYNHYGRPKVQYTQTDAGLVPVTTPPNMSAFSQPGQRGAAQDFPGETPPPPPPVPSGSAIPGTQKETPFTEVEQKTVSFAQEMADSIAQMDAITASGYDPTNTQDFIGSNTGVAGNFATSPEGQQFNTEKARFVDALIRLRTGAAATKEEQETYGKRWFPVPGDKPQTIQAKQRARQQALKSILPGVEDKLGKQNPELLQSLRGMATGGEGKTTAQPKTQADYDALPSGAVFIDPDDGKQYRKP